MMIRIKILYKQMNWKYLLLSLIIFFFLYLKSYYTSIKNIKNDFSS